MITDIRLQQFRSYSDESFELSPSVNIIVGPNASGKTNLLEALLLIARGHSYRGSDSDLIQFEAPWARLDAHTEQGLRTIKLTAEPLTKNYEIDDKTHKRLGLQHSLPVVLFEPNHLVLLSGSPEQRRNYLDDLLEQTTPGYATTRRQYKRTLAQRNSLLKREHSSDQHLFPWNVRLSELAGQVVRQRSTLATDINTTLPALYRELVGTKTNVSLSYQSRWAPEQYESHLLKKLEADTALDRLRGFTAAGPHREDILVTFDGHHAQETASRGEARTLVLGLKIIELQLLEAVRGLTPLLLLDDVFSELDGKRRRALTTHLQPYQTFITTTDADVVVKNFTDAASIIPLS